MIMTGVGVQTGRFKLPVIAAFEAHEPDPGDRWSETKSGTEQHAVPGYAALYPGYALLRPSRMTALRSFP
jgi:hypothetical protein